MSWAVRTSRTYRTRHWSELTTVEQAEIQAEYRLTEHAWRMAAEAYWEKVGRDES